MTSNTAIEQMFNELLVWRETGVWATGVATFVQCVVVAFIVSRMTSCFIPEPVYVSTPEGP